MSDYSNFVIRLWLIQTDLNSREIDEIESCIGSFNDRFTEIDGAPPFELKREDPPEDLVNELVNMTADHDFGWLQSCVAEYACDPANETDLLGQFIPPKVLIACKPESRPAQSAKHHHPIAQWGLATPDRLLAMVYGISDERLVWHELFHLFDADDCYQLPDEGPTCSCTNCIMQYVPTRSNSDWDHPLCPANKARVTKYLRSCAGCLD